MLKQSHVGRQKTERMDWFGRLIPMGPIPMGPIPTGGTGVAGTWSESQPWSSHTLPQLSVHPRGTSTEVSGMSSSHRVFPMLDIPGGTQVTFTPVMNLQSFSDPLCSLDSQAIVFRIHEHLGWLQGAPLTHCPEPELLLALGLWMSAVFFHYYFQLNPCLEHKVSRTPLRTQLH